MRNKGFTLIEVVVVIAVVALLAAIITPVVTKQIDDAKIARAKNEVQVIAAAISQFYKDVGVFPAMDADGTQHALERLVSGAAVETIDSSSTADDYGYTAAGNDDWYDDGQTTAAKKVDIFDNHLNANDPESNGSNAYATSGEFRWKGPYMPPIGADPWGHWYVCNIDYAYSGSSVQCVVMSAGPDGNFDTAADPASTVAAPSGDDIWAVVHMR